jgi:hypothetical protein
MSHFAKLDNNYKVIQIIVSEQDYITSGSVGDSFRWVQTSYNGNFRKNYAGIGYFYDRIRDAFIPPQPYPSWILNEDTCLWDTPTPMPDDGQRYTWNEETVNWDLIEVE